MQVVESKRNRTVQMQSRVDEELKRDLDVWLVQNNKTLQETVEAMIRKHLADPDALLVRELSPYEWRVVETFLAFWLNPEHSDRIALRQFLSTHLEIPLPED